MIFHANYTVIARSDHWYRQISHLQWNCHHDTILGPLSPLDLAMLPEAVLPVMCCWLFHVILHEVQLYVWTGCHFPVIKIKGGCKSNQNFLHYATSSLPPFASIMRQPLINMTWCHSSCRVFLCLVVSFHRTACVVEMEEGIFIEESDICKSLRSDGTLHKKRRGKIYWKGSQVIK